MIAAIIQAREGSSRLPLKILKKISNKSIIQIIHQRLKISKKLNSIYFAIPKKNKILKSHLLINKYNFFIGSEKNVLERYYFCAKKIKAKTIVRITSDCPFVDGKMLDRMLEVFYKKKLDYISNGLNPYFPDGMDIEIFTFDALKTAYEKSKKKKELEHVTFYISENPKKFKIHSYKDKKFKNNSNIRLTLDNEYDFDLISKIFQELNFNFNADYNKISKLIDSKPELFLENKFFSRNYYESEILKKYNFINSKRIIPSGNQMISKNPMSILPFQWPLYYEKAKGCNIWTIDKKKYTDFSLMGVGSNSLGYANSKIDTVVEKKIKLGSMSTINCYEEYDLANKLIEINPWAEMVRFARTGGEINSIAIRIARAASGKNKVAFCGYHGWHDWYLSANIANKKNLNSHLMKGFFLSGVPSDLKNTSFPFKFNDINSFKRIINQHEIGVVKIEVFRNVPPKKIFLKQLREICNQKKIVLIFDECTSGFRATFGGIYNLYGINPDIVLYGKALGNGYPITACVGKRSIMEASKKSFISSTFWSERIGFSAGIATLNEMEKIKSWEKLNILGEYFKKNLKKISDDNKIGLEITGLPALTSYYIPHKYSDIFQAFITQELLKYKYLGTQTFYMSTAHSKKKIDKYLDRLNDIFKIIKENFDNKNFIKKLKGPLPKKPFERMN